MSSIKVIMNVNGTTKHLIFAEDHRVRDVMQDCLEQNVIPGNMPLDGFFFVHNENTLHHERLYPDEKQGIEKYIHDMLCNPQKLLPDNPDKISLRQHLFQYFETLESLMKKELPTDAGKLKIDKQLDEILSNLTENPDKSLIRKALFSHFELNVTPTKAACSILLDDDPDEWRAQMSCGHAISTDAMIDQIKDELKCGRTQFYCRICPLEWKYNSIRHVVARQLTTDELRSLDEKLCENALIQQAETKRCPWCRSLCQRNDRLSFTTP